VYRASKNEVYPKIGTSTTLDYYRHRPPKAGLNSKLHAVCNGASKLIILPVSEGQMSGGSSEGGTMARFRSVSDVRSKFRMSGALRVTGHMVYFGRAPNIASFARTQAERYAEAS
jgi:hypothetical protein